MSVIQLAEPSADVLQLNIYNANIGGGLNKRATYSVPPSIHWCVVGTVFNDAVTESDIPTLLAAIEALVEVTSVNGDQFWGQMPSAVEASDHELVLHVTSGMSSTIGTGGDTFAQVVQNHETIKPPANKKWGLWVVRVPAALDDTKIAALESAMTGITGIALTEHLIDGSTSSRQVGNATLVVAAHVRIDPVEV